VKNEGNAGFDSALCQLFFLIGSSHSAIRYDIQTAPSQHHVVQSICQLRMISSRWWAPRR
jgi:hypothetical protein